MPPRIDDIRQRRNQQTYVFEYVLEGGSFDGLTVAPLIGIDPTQEDTYVAPDPVDGIRRLRLPAGTNLGLIDLSLGGQVDDGGIGDRFVQWVLGGNTGDPASVVFGVNGFVGVADNSFVEQGLATVPTVLQSARSLAGQSGFYERACIKVPQGAYLAIAGMPAPADGSVSLIRFSVAVPDTPWTAALLEEYCCCDEGAEDGPDSECPEIFDIQPSTFDVPLDTQTLTIFGSGFRDGLAIEATRNPPDSPAAASLTNFSIIDSNTATVDVSFATLPGTYTLTIFDPFDPEGCSGSGEFTVNEGLECPEITDALPSVLTISNLTSGATLTGTNLDTVTQVEFRDSGGTIRLTIPAFAFINQTATEIVLPDFALPAPTATGEGQWEASAVGCPLATIAITVIQPA